MHMAYKIMGYLGLMDGFNYIRVFYGCYIHDLKTVDDYAGVDRSTVQYNDLTIPHGWW